MARRTWESLSPNHRKRLASKGITARGYNSGAPETPLAAARGHGSNVEENARRKFLRSRTNYVKKTAEILGRDEDEQHEHFMLYTESEQQDIMVTQEVLASRYSSGDHVGATTGWWELQARFKGEVPYWLVPYRATPFI